jgi:hypothetical protein
VQTRRVTQYALKCLLTNPFCNVECTMRRCVNRVDSTERARAAALSSRSDYTTLSSRLFPRPKQDGAATADDDDGEKRLCRGSQREKKSDEKCMGKLGDDGHIYLGVDGASAFSDAAAPHLYHAQSINICKRALRCGSFRRIDGQPYLFEAAIFIPHVRPRVQRASSLQFVTSAHLYFISAERARGVVDFPTRIYICRTRPLVFRSQLRVREFRRVMRTPEFQSSAAASF